MVAAAARSLDDAGIPVRHLAVRVPSLDEAFLAITGHHPAGPAIPPQARRRWPGHPMTLTQTAVMARRNLLHVLSDPQQMIGMSVQPLMFLLLFVYVFGGAISGSTRGYLQFVLRPARARDRVRTTQTAVGLNADFQSGLIDRFRSLPMARLAVVAGRITADIARTAWSSLIIVGVAVGLGVRFHGGLAGAVGAFGLVLALGVAMCWLMAFLGVALRSPESVQVAGFMLIMPLTFASSVLVPAGTCPAGCSHSSRSTRSRSSRARCAG